MKKSKLVITIAFLVYLIIAFLIFYSIDKKMLAVFCALGAALYAALIKRFSDKCWKYTN